MKSLQNLAFLLKAAVKFDIFTQQNKFGMEQLIRIMSVLLCVLS